MGDPSEGKWRWARTPVNSPTSASEEQRCYNIRITSKADTPMSPSPEPIRRVVTFSDRTETYPRTSPSSTSAEVENMLNTESEERRAVASVLASWPQQPFHKPTPIPTHPRNSPSVASSEGYNYQNLTPEKLSSVSKWLKEASEALHDPVWRPKDTDNLTSYPPTTPTSCVALTAAPTYLSGSHGYTPPMNQMPYPTNPNIQQASAPQHYPTYPYPQPAYGSFGYTSAPAAQSYGQYQSMAQNTSVTNSHFRPIAAPVATYGNMPTYAPAIVHHGQIDAKFICPNCHHQYWYLDNKTLIPVVPKVNRQAAENSMRGNNFNAPQPARPLNYGTMTPQAVLNIAPQIQLPDVTTPPPGYHTVVPQQHNIAAVIPQQHGVPATANPYSRKRPGGIYDTTVRKLSFTPK